MNKKKKNQISEEIMQHIVIKATTDVIRLSENDIFKCKCFEILGSNNIAEVQENLEERFKMNIIGRKKRNETQKLQKTIPEKTTAKEIIQELGNFQNWIDDE